MYCCSDRAFMTTETKSMDNEKASLNESTAGSSITGSLAAATEQNEGLQEELEAERVVFDSLFSTRTPKDGWAGLSSGLKSVTKGLAGGVATLVTAPIVGAQQEGAKGFVTGLAMGVAGAVALPVTGVCVGAYQLTRGIANSGTAIQSANKGMIWNEKNRVWEFYTLEQELQQIEAEELQYQQGGSGSIGTASTSGAMANERQVADRTYYDLLQVSTNANNVQLKKAYYKQSRLVHPDRNAGKPVAEMEASNKQFQELSQAYQILSNEQSRAYYDKHGLLTDEAAQEMKLHEIDPKIFFAVMFGSEAVRPYIGELWIANKADMIMKEEFFKTTINKDGGDADSDSHQHEVDLAQHYAQAVKRTAQEETRQRRRIVEIAMNLRNRVEQYTSGAVDEAEFICTCQEEAAIITKGTFGDVFATAIGFALEVEAAEYIGSQTSFLGLESQGAKWKKKSQAWGNQFKILSTGIGAARAGAKAYNELEQVQKKQLKGQDSLELNNTKAATLDSSGMDEATVEKVTQQFEQSLPVFLELAWAINIQDITQTLNKVCFKLFRDHAETLDLESRIQRAEAVKVLGREFYAIGAASKKTNFKNVSAQDLRARAEVAAMTTMAKAQGQDISDKDAEEMIRQARAMEAQRQANQ
ncbi:hypothetical protein MPSEU_000116200 [Mayamaea pseudoterrestris]|nr:hypothetical protein MPSEU_000116200 [Mayamaea pseudoterrestris]